MKDKKFIKHLVTLALAIFLACSCFGLGFGLGKVSSESNGYVVSSAESVAFSVRFDYSNSRLNFNTVVSDASYYLYNDDTGSIVEVITGLRRYFVLNTPARYYIAVVTPDTSIDSPYTRSFPVYIDPSSPDLTPFSVSYNSRNGKMSWAVKPLFYYSSISITRWVGNTAVDVYTFNLSVDNFVGFSSYIVSKEGEYTVSYKLTGGFTSAQSNRIVVHELPTPSQFSALHEIIQAGNDFLSMQIFGSDFTLGDILFIGFGLALLGFVVKFFLGG